MSSMHDIALSADEVRATEAAAYGEACEVFKKGLTAIMAHYGIGYQAAVTKLRQLDLNYDEMRRLAKKATRPKVRLAQPEPDDRKPDEDEDDKPSADLAKLADAYRRAFPEAKLSKEQAIAFVGTQLPEGRELLRLSKQRSINKNYPGQYVLEKVTTDVSQPLPADIAKLSDAALTSLYREGRFDKLAGPAGPPSSTPRTMSPLQDASARSARKPRVVRDSGPGNGVIGDRANLIAGDEGTSGRDETPDFAAQVRALMDTEGLSEIEAMSRIVAEAREARIAKVGW